MEKKMIPEGVSLKQFLHAFGTVVIQLFFSRIAMIRPFIKAQMLVMKKPNFSKTCKTRKKEN